VIEMGKILEKAWLGTYTCSCIPIIGMYVMPIDRVLIVLMDFGLKIMLILKEQ
jgi:hypothetical protein